VSDMGIFRQLTRLGNPDAKIWRPAQSQGSKMVKHSSGDSRRIQYAEYTQSNSLGPRNRLDRLSDQRLQRLRDSVALRGNGQHSGRLTSCRCPRWGLGLRMGDYLRHNYRVGFVRPLRALLLSPIRSEITVSVRHPARPGSPRPSGAGVYGSWLDRLPPRRPILCKCPPSLQVDVYSG
jgi:hypothetical protein